MRRGHRRRVAAVGLACILGLYAGAAYLVLPAFWTVDDRRRPEGSPWLTRTGQGLPGDPVNIGVRGSQEALAAAMRAAGWDPADPVTFESSLRIVGSVILDRPYPDAPVSPLFLDERAQDRAFEKPVGRSADRRSHVRFWRTGSAGEAPLWLGSASFDSGVGFSHYTGAVTHDISPAVDAARDALVADLERTGRVASVSRVEASGASATRRNGEGDRYETDGLAAIVTLNPDEPP